MTNQLTVGDIFAGFGGWSAGARDAGHRLLWAVEHDPAIAQAYAVNLGNHIIVSGAQDVDIHRLEPPDILLASPPCQSHSQARSKKLATRDDAEIGGRVLDYIRILRPRFVFIENVEGWKRSKSFQRIFNGLNELGYWTNVMVLNAADFGVPQTRKRLILRASCSGFLPPLPAPTKWRGWYDAIVDLIPNLPESKFADWQLARLPKDIKILLVDSAGWNDELGKLPVMKAASEPSGTILSNLKGRSLRAFIVGDQMADGGNSVTIRSLHEPVQTIDTRLASKRRAWLSQGRVVKMTPRALARFQSIPDEAVLPESAPLACKCIGNAVPPLFAQRLLEGL